VGGTVRAKRRGIEEEGEMSRFGQDLLYINVGYVESKKEDTEGGFVERFFREEGSRLSSIQRQMQELGASLDDIGRVRLLFILDPQDLRYPVTRLFSQEDYGM
jgi:hypothetical protein